MLIPLAGGRQGFPAGQRIQQLATEHLRDPGPEFKTIHGIERQQRFVSAYLISLGNPDIGHHAVERRNHTGSFGIPPRAEQVCLGLGQFCFEALQPSRVLFNRALPGIHRQLGSCGSIGGRLQRFAGGQVPANQRSGSLQLSAGVLENRLLAGQRCLVIPIAHLLRSDLGFQIVYLSLGLSQGGLDIGLIQSHQKLSLTDTLPLRYRSGTDTARQGSGYRQLLRRKNLSVKGQNRRVGSRLNLLNLNTPTPLGGTDLCRLRACHLENHETGDTDGENQYGNESFGHYLLAS